MLQKKTKYSLCNSSIDCSIAVVGEKLTELKHVFIVEDNTQDFMYKPITNSPNYKLCFLSLRSQYQYWVLLMMKWREVKHTVYENHKEKNN